MRHLLLLFFLFSFLFSNAQKATYDIVLFGNVIGWGKAESRFTPEGNVEYTLVTDASARVMMKDRKSSSDIRLVFRNRQLQNYILKSAKEDESQHVEMKWNGKHYSIVNNDTKSIEKYPVNFTTTQLFFEEPVNKSKVYVERLNIWVPIEKVDDNTYHTKVDGSNNFYTYENGKLVEMRIKNIINIYMKLKES